jgi:hypothetical protein
MSYKHISRLKRLTGLVDSSRVSSYYIYVILRNVERMATHIQHTFTKRHHENKIPQQQTFIGLK